MKTDKEIKLKFWKGAKKESNLCDECSRTGPSAGICWTLGQRQREESINRWSEVEGDDYGAFAKSCVFSFSLSGSKSRGRLDECPAQH